MSMELRTGEVHDFGPGVRKKKSTPRKKMRCRVWTLRSSYGAPARWDIPTNSLSRRKRRFRSTNDDVDADMAANDQWIALVESWKSPKKMHECDINKDNRSKAQFSQATGSQSYEVFIENIGDKYKDQDPTALDLFKECHFSKKNGFKPAVQSVITEMENQLSTQIGSEGIEGGEGTEVGEGTGGEGTERGEGSEGSQQPELVNEVVHAVLSEKTKKNKFLQNVKIQIVQPTSREQNPQADLAAENVELRAIINTQQAKMEELSKEVLETKESRCRDREEMKKMQAEMNAKLELVLRQVRPS
ncbi:unnamed protein product [Urochloa humidicola]